MGRIASTTFLILVLACSGAHADHRRAGRRYTPSDFVLRLYTGEGGTTPKRLMLLVGFRFGLARACELDNVDMYDLMEVEKPEQIAAFSEGLRESRAFLHFHRCGSFMRVEATRRLDNIRAMP